MHHCDQRTLHDCFTFKTDEVILIYMGDESEISETVIELFNKNIQGITGHRELDLWMAGGEPHDKIRQERLGSCSKETDFQFSGGG